MLKLKLQYFDHLMARTNSLEKTLMLGKIGGRRRSGQWRMRWLDGITDSMDLSLSKLGGGEGQGSPACCSPWDHKELDMTEPLNKNSLANVSWNGQLKGGNVLISSGRGVRLPKAGYYI